MSENLYIGISKEQLSRLVLGGEIGKRPYYDGCVKFRKHAKNRYDGDIRVFVRVLDDKEEEKEPKEAFF